MADIRWLDSVKSTNSSLAEIADEALNGTVVVARAQTAGRGQRGNSWEAEPGKNLTFSILLKPDGIDAVNQFRISEAVALGVVDALRSEVPFPQRVAVKWPNDIYFDDRKICGILIENSLMGKTIKHSIAGIGINVNQREFVSDAPNPVSLWQIKGSETQLEPFLKKVVDAVLSRMNMPWNELHQEYMSALWRRCGCTYRDASSGEIFSAKIADVASSGHITLLPDAPEALPHVYAFKEVAVIL
ncbi:MAG: biotin--[acetyl-CoA-carboxylase] ligase [Muribaculum sp.]|nr:biotin--[acetyl-CoA-carboxylase] ligase [Muribaculum sp.]